MTTHKEIEKQLKKPDTFQDLGLKFVTYVTNNKGRIALMMSPLLLVAIIGYGVFTWQKSQASNRRTAVSKILTLQADEQSSVTKVNEEIQKEIDALRQPSSEPNADSLIKISELEKRLKDVKPDHTGSNNAFKDFYQANKSNPEGWMAGIYWASSLLEDGKLAEAKPIVEEITKASLGNKFFQIQSRYTLAGILEDLGEFDAALKEAEILTGLVEDEAKAMMLLLKGEILYFKKDLAAARPVLNEILEKHGSTREAQAARSLLAEIGPA